jgi:magnesium-transporting ATPase (P-type)
MEEKKNIDDLRNLRIEETIKLFISDLTTGLKQTEVEIYCKQYGYNEVPEKKSNPLLKFLSKFWGLIAWVLKLSIDLSYGFLVFKAIPSNETLIVIGYAFVFSLVINDFIKYVLLNKWGMKYE